MHADTYSYSNVKSLSGDVDFLNPNSAVLYVVFSKLS